MAKAMKTLKRVSTLTQAIAAYGGEKAFAKAFGLRGKAGDTLADWQRHGVPRGHQLGLCVGLEMRGAEPLPELFGAETWEDVPGVSKRWP
jgi:hypothetical protein